MISKYNEVIYAPQHFFLRWRNWSSGARPPHYRGFTITLRHTTLSRSPLYEWSARCRDLYVTTHKIHKKQTSTKPAVFKPIIPASELPQTHTIERAATSLPTWSFWILIARVYLFKTFLSYILCIPRGYNVLVFLLLASITRVHLCFSWVVEVLVARKVVSPPPWTHQMERERERVWWFLWNRNWSLTKNRQGESKQNM